MIRGPLPCWVTHSNNPFDFVMSENTQMLNIRWLYLYYKAVSVSDHTNHHGFLKTNSSLC